MTGYTTSDLPNAPLADEVIVNRNGSTGRQRVADLSTQLAGSGPLAEQIAALPTAAELQTVEQIALSARDIAVLNSATYPDEATGRAAVADGAYFKVAGSGDVAFREYRRTNATTSVLVAAYPSKDYIDSGKLTAGVAMTASGAGYETINPDAAGYGIVTAQTDRVTITKGQVGYPITISKVTAATGTLTWFGVHLKIPYAALSDLNKVLTLDAVTVAGVAPNYATVVKEVTDWNPINDPVGLDLAALMSGGAGVNLYSVIAASSKASIYQARTYLYVLLAYQNPTPATVNAATATWTIQPRFSSMLDVIANKLTPALRTELASVNPNVSTAVALVLAPKTALLSAGLNKQNAASTATLDHTYTRSDAGQTVNIGYDFTMLSASGFAYFWTKIFDSYAANASKKFRVFLKSNGKTATVRVRFTNASAWGSSDGSIGMMQDTGVTLSAANNYQATVDIDYSAMAAFYAAAGRLQAGFFIIAYDAATAEAVQFSTYCCDISDVGSMEGDMTSGGISRLASIAELEAAVEALQNDAQAAAYITCWGDSLTAGGGWTTTLAALTGLPVYNGGTGGETSRTIMARQGGDAMVVNNITIPATTTPVLIASRATDGGIKTALGATVTPLLQGGAHVNPCKIGDVVGTLAWTGSSYADMTGTWTFTRASAGAEVQITRPTAIRTDFDINKRGGIQIIFMGQNGGYTNVDDLIWQHRMMIAHSKAKHTIILGLSSGSAAARADYEAAMRLAFGRYFIPLREYLATPIYTNGVITSCYGLADAGLTPTQADLDAIATGTVPPQCFTDGIHYTAATKTVLGNMIYARMRDLNVV